LTELLLPRGFFRDHQSKAFDVRYVAHMFIKQFSSLLGKGRSMHKAKGVSIMNMKFPPDVREKLLEWAELNVSSMNAETVRSIRERIAREKREQAAG
jgi:hypothetical protein